MAETTWSQTVAASLLTAALTLAGTSCQQAHQDNRADSLKFLDGAQATAQETSRLLDDGYNALAKLLNGMEQKGWGEFSKGSWHEYIEFHRGWRQQLIAEHFKLSRYFGKDMANQLVHIDEIDIRPTNNLSSPNPCAPPGDESNFDVQKLASQIECYSRFVTVSQDTLDANMKSKKADEIFDAMESVLTTKNTSWDLLRHYDKTSVSYIRRLDARLTALGVSQVKNDN